MRAIVLLLALASPAVAQMPMTGAPEPARCRSPGADRAQVQPKGPARPRPLIEMPDARPVLTVYRQVNGCSVLLVKEGGRIVEEPVGAPERRRVFRP
ncbi:hypothetical protein [Sphingomonas lenta]|uniref:Uncharacterized protein n=1 Tax=Sphingomonas lenta TaxID=1141887 RepID=A0A2A2SJG0_9SPHN|nr:hypothetical protein [Sphingomonas lenta]PAX09355.1 hypothetical protein CKY28_00945 [Sphingomonas lenta]